MRRTKLPIPRLRGLWLPFIALPFIALPFIGLALGLGLAGGWIWTSAPADALREHDGGEYHFRYPARFELAYDTFEAATPDSRIVALRGTDGSVLMVHSFAPASNLSAQQFADEIARQRRSALAELGVRGGQVQHETLERVRSAGALREAVRQEFDIESGGLHFSQLARYVRVAVGDRELFLSLHTPARHAASAESAFADVLESLEFEHPLTAANQRPPHP